MVPLARRCGDGGCHASSTVARRPSRHTVETTCFSPFIACRVRLGEPRRDLRAGPEPQLGEDALDVTFGSPQRDDQLGRDLLVGQTLGHKPGHLTLAARELTEGVASGGGRRAVWLLVERIDDDVVETQVVPRRRASSKASPPRSQRSARRLRTRHPRMSLSVALIDCQATSVPPTMVAARSPSPPRPSSTRALQA